MIGRTVRLEPLTEGHAKDLAEQATMDTFRHFQGIDLKQIDEPEMRRFVQLTFARPRAEPFAIILLATGKAVGVSCFLDIQPENSNLEIGSTWYGEAFRGTKVNPEAKLLLLTEAFETRGCERVLLKTDERNMRSRAAILKLGAVYEGTMRRAVRMPDGFMRSNVIFSILREEWPSVRANLEQRLA